MGVIASQAGQRRTLGARLLLGRAAGCDLRLDDPSASAEHAVLYWNDGAWYLRDLGSTNGTFVGTQRLRVGEPMHIRAGAVMGFGAPAELHRWTLVDDSGPRAVARGIETGQTREAVHGLLQLPDDESPVVSLFERSGAWVCDRGDAQALANDQQVIQIGGAAWLLELPPPIRSAHVPPTRRRAADHVELEASVLRFRVSQDQEYVELLVIHGARELSVPARSHHALLLLLARRRLDDANSGVPPGEQGWTYADELSSEFDATRTKLNLDICRARRQLAELGVAGAGNLIERRSTTRQLRIGCSRLEISSFAT